MTGRAWPGNLVLLRNIPGTTPSPATQEEHMLFRRSLFYSGLSVAVVLLALGVPAARAAEELPPVLPNDNRRAAGTVADDATLSLKLRAALGLWKPEGEEGPALRVEAFGEEGDALRAPAPLLRVREGTTVVVSVRNDLDVTLRVHGLCARDGQPCAPVDVPTARQQRGPLHARPRRHVSLLGDDHRDAVAVSRRVRYPAIRRDCRRSAARSESRPIAYSSSPIGRA